MVITFDTVHGSNSKKVAFFDSSHQNLSNDTYSFWLLGGLHFPIVFHCFGIDIIMTSFLVTWFSNLYILWNFEQTISLKSFNVVSCLWQVL